MTPYVRKVHKKNLACSSEHRIWGRGVLALRHKGTHLVRSAYRVLEGKRECQARRVPIHLWIKIVLAREKFRSYHTYKDKAIIMVPCSQYPSRTHEYKTSRFRIWYKLPNMQKTWSGRRSMPFEVQVCEEMLACWVLNMFALIYYWTLLHYSKIIVDRDLDSMRSLLCNYCYVMISLWSTKHVVQHGYPLMKKHAPNRWFHFGSGEMSSGTRLMQESKSCLTMQSCMVSILWWRD